MVENENENIKQISFHPHSTRYSEKRKPELSLPCVKEIFVEENNIVKVDNLAKNDKSNNVVDSSPKAFVSTVKKRTWEQWSIEEMNMFFDALTIHGKNFENIWKFMFGKMGKNMTRNREQIRHFYYRTWAKLSKYIKGKDSTNMKHNYIELYTLLSYGELRRKVGFNIDETRFQRLVRDNLSQLALNGSTCMKLKGKKIRIKLPTCLALKKILSLQGEKESSEEKKINLPQTISVLLWPRTNFDWVYVQSISHNPRVKFRLHPSTRIGDIVKVLERKWQSRDMQLIEAFNRDLNAPTNCEGASRAKNSTSPSTLVSLTIAQSHLQTLLQPNKARILAGLTREKVSMVAQHLNKVEPGEIMNHASDVKILYQEGTEREVGNKVENLIPTYGEGKNVDGEILELEDLALNSFAKLTFGDLYNLLGPTESLHLEYKIQENKGNLVKGEFGGEEPKKIFNQLFSLALSETCDKRFKPNTTIVPTTIHSANTLPIPSTTQQVIDSSEPIKIITTPNVNPLTNSCAIQSVNVLPATCYVSIKPYLQQPISATCYGQPGLGNNTPSVTVAVSPKLNQPPRRYRGRLRRSAPKNMPGFGSNFAPKTIAPKPIALLTPGTYRPALGHNAITTLPPYYTLNPIAAAPYPFLSASSGFNMTKPAPTLGSYNMSNHLNKLSASLPFNNVFVTARPASNFVRSFTNLITTNLAELKTTQQSQVSTVPEPATPTVGNCFMDISLPSQPISSVPPFAGESPNGQHNNNEKLIDLALGDLSWLSSHVSLQNDELGAFKLNGEEGQNMQEGGECLFFKNVAKSFPSTPYSHDPLKNSTFNCIENEISITELMEVSPAQKLLSSTEDESQIIFGPTSTPIKASPNFKGLIVSDNSLDFASTFLSLNVEKDGER